MIYLTSRNDSMDRVDRIESVTIDSIPFQQVCLRRSFVKESRQSQTTASSPDHTRSSLSRSEKSYDAGNNISAFDGNNDRSTGGHTGPDGAMQASTDTSNTSRPVALWRRSSSTDTARRIVVETSKVHFAASPYLQADSKASEYYAPAFRNPFSEALEAQSRRTSDASQISDIPIPQGFGGHRDTLALLLDEANDDDDDEEQNSRNDTPTQARYTILHRRFPIR